MSEPDGIGNGTDLEFKVMLVRMMIEVKDERKKTRKDLVDRTSP